MSTPRLPVRPRLDQLKRQAKELLKSLHAGEADAVAALRAHHPTPIEPAAAKLADAQLILARIYQAQSWPRLVDAVNLANAIWHDDLRTVEAIVTRNPHLIHEAVLIRPDSNWGTPLSYAANLGRDRIIVRLHELGARDLEHAAGRAALQGQVATVKLIYELAGRPKYEGDALGGPAYTLSLEGTAILISLGTPVVDQEGRRLAPVSVVLESDSRKPAAKHGILELYAKHGVTLPDTPTMALHRGRLDLLEEHLRRDPTVLHRRFTHREIYPTEMGCADPRNATVGTPLDGVTLLHMCADYDELDIARWLIERGADVNARSTIDDDGFGGYTPLFNAVVSQANFWMNFHKRGPFVAPFAALLLARGADPNLRASVRKQLHPGYREEWGSAAMHEFRDVTALSYGRRFQAPVFVSEPALRLLAEAGGTE